MNPPSQLDFDPWNGNLDAQGAWEHFGGLDISSAYQKFCENPIYYQEDFMWMGPKALEFYFPVIDKYLREHQTSSDDPDDGQAWILGRGMSIQIEQTENDSMLSRIAELASFVRSNLSRYATQKDDVRQIDDTWLKVEIEIQKKKS